ncbi:sugar phosphate isomerase/epimerase family protein [Flavobacteriaceae sp. LMIT009]
MRQIVKPLVYTILFSFCVLVSCKNSEQKKESSEDTAETETAHTPFFKLSLAQWSMNKMIRFDSVSPYTFAAKAKEWGFEGIEYVSQLYTRELAKYDNVEEGMKAIVERCKQESEAAGVKNVLIMVDREGDLASPDEAARNQAVENHKKWVDAAAELGCHAIRVNTSGTNDPAEYLASAQDGLRKLSEYAATKNINVIVENHGGLSSDAPKLVEVINAVNMPNCGTLPDFGNWCITWGENGCDETYPDMYDGLERLMTVAKAVSAKAHDFDADGNETEKDYVRMLQIVKDAGYTGYIGVEYEGEKLGEAEGIIATRDLLINAAKKVK